MLTVQVQINGEVIDHTRVWNTQKLDREGCTIYKCKSSKGYEFSVGHNPENGAMYLASIVANVVSLEDGKRERTK